VRCPFCANGLSQVLDSREVGRLVRRRRACRSCGRRFTTYESQAAPSLQVVKRDGRIEGYDRAKLLSSLQAAVFKRGILPEGLQATVDAIEAEISNLGVTAVESRQLADFALERLSLLDEVAYLRYASGVRKFNAGEDFLAAIDEVRGQQRRVAQARIQLQLQFDEDQPHWN
jgi:transcriptional repressor NrdR